MSLFRRNESSEPSIESFRIHRYDPVKQRSRVIFTMLFLGIAGAALFVSGYVFSQYHVENRQKQNKQLRQQIKALEQLRDEQSAQIARLSQSSNVDSMAVQEMQRSLSAREIVIAELKEDVAFYQMLLSPEELQPGLHVQSLSLERLGESTRYTYQMVLTHQHEGKREAKGSVEFVINGTQNDKPRSLNLRNLSTRQEKITYNFTYFQRFEGSFKLPDEFTPVDVFIRVIPDSKKRKAIEVGYSWETLFSES